MRLWVRAERRKRNHVGWLIVKQGIADTRHADAPQLSDAITVAVHLDVALGVSHLPRGWVAAVSVARGQRRVARVALDVGVHLVSA